MGAWGENPQDNDTAADWYSTVLQDLGVERKIEKGLKSKWHEERRAAADLVRRLGYCYIYDINLLDKHVQMAIDAIEGLIKDTEWINLWKDPQLVKTKLKKELRELESLQR